jgi:hypothetical protein
MCCVTAGELELAPLFPVADFEGSLGDYLEALYTRYEETVHRADLQLWGVPLVAWERKARDGRDLTFWHLITDSSCEHTEGTRRLSLMRCALLPRVCDVLERLACDDIRVCWWRERGKRVLVAPVDFSMVVMLRRIRGTYVLKTAWPTGTPRGRRYVFQRAASRWAACRCWPAPRVIVPA